MKKLTKLSAISLTVALSVSGALPGLNTTIQAHATSYGGYTQPTYHTVASYYISAASVKQMALAARTMKSSASQVAQYTKVLGAYGYPATIATQLAVNAQLRSGILYAADNNLRVICSIKDASVHTSYSTIVTFTPAK